MRPVTRRPLTVVATATLVGAVLLGGTAWAAWSVAGAGAGAASAGSVVTPTVTATRSATSPTSAIDLSWTASGQLPGATYSVTRDGVTISCSASPCTDSGLAPGTTYSYVVTSKVGTSWSAAANPASATTGGALVATTTTVQSSQNPARSGVPVTLTATVTAGSGSPSGTVTFKDNGTTIACSGGSARTLSAGSASCQTSFATTAVHPVTAEYSGAPGFAASTTPSPLNQRIVNGNVTGLAFANVKVDGALKTPACTGAGTSAVTCSVSSGNNAALTADVGFVSSTGTATIYATDAATTLPWTATGKGATSGSVSVAASSSTSTSGSAGTSKNGSNSAALTVTFSDGANSFTATLTVN